MNETKQLWLLAGGNGAGKSTFFRLFLEPKGIKFINADLIARDLDSENQPMASYKASHLAERLRQKFLEEGLSFCFETVFSHVSKIDFVARAKSLRYEVILVFIHLDNPELNEARVSQRVSEGGHDVPAEKIYGRLPRTVKNIMKTLPLVDSAFLLDNSTRNHPFRQIAVVHLGRKRILCDDIPAWALSMLSDIP
mgnify:FL=1